MYTYRIVVRGQVDVGELNSLSPQQMTPVEMDADLTVFSICTDQSGLIGLLRHLHHLRIEFCSITRQFELQQVTLERNP